MRKLKKKLCAFTVFVFITLTPVFTHTFSAGAKFFGLSMHPRGAANAPLIPYKFDSRGIFVLHPGVTLNFDYFLWKDIVSVKAVQGLYADCAMQFAGFSHVGFRIRLFKIGRFSMNTGIGPTFLYRQSWYKLPGYKDKLTFYRGTKDEDWQYRFILYGGEIENNIQVNDKFDVSISVIPGGIDLINVSFGARYNYKAP
ncbi:hypothetical protein V1L52_07330 [Treponema sp. HNW]|uniref:hypothetical protein n=1 Tax=Treponema sp. HNW TaxID=3116654 RepID=UPI003D0C9BD8